MVLFDSILDLLLQRLVCGLERCVHGVLRGDRKSRISFAEKMQEGAISFPRGQIEEVAALVMNAARARNGWRVIREATVIHRI